MLSKQLSRRRMLRHLGAGAMVTWTAPVLTTATARPALAASAPPCDCSDPCSFLFCPNRICHCARRVRGGCVCVAPDPVGNCPPDFDCGAGLVCVEICGGNPLCFGLCSSSSIQGSRHG